MALRVSLWPALLLLPAMALAEDAPAPVTAPVDGPAGEQTAEFRAVPAKNPDPWEKFNRSMFRFNDAADRYVLKPVAKGYKAVTPDPVRTGVTNFFSNLRSPLVVMNDLLQGKFRQAGGDTLRFVVNSTVGVVGVMDVATRIKLPAHDEDFGQTLGVWGVPSGPYLMMPFLGPSSVRDAGGFAVDRVANPRRRLISNEADWALTGVDVVNSRASLLDLEDIIQGDRYLFIRDLYLQRREYAVHDGQIQDDPFLDDPMDDDAGDEAPAQQPSAVSPEAAPESHPDAAPAEPEAAPEPSPGEPDIVPPEVDGAVPDAAAGTVVTPEFLPVDTADASGA